MKYFGILPLLLLTLVLKAQSYLGNISYGKSTFSYKINLTEIEGETKAYFSSIEMNAYEIPCQNTVVKNDSLNFYVISDYYTYEYKFHKRNKNFVGKLSVYSNESEQLLNTFATELIDENDEEYNIIEKQEVSFTSNGLKFCGTIWKPKKPLKKGLLFVTSSQGNDRSGSNAEAFYFASLGYIVFNYDKRGTGKSEGDWQSATIEELCSDDISAIHFFAKKSNLSLSEIGIKGNSQGGIKVPYIMSKLPELNFGVSISCPSGTLLESDLTYWKNTNIDKIGQQNIEVAAKVQKAGYDYLANNINYSKLNAIKNKYHNQDWYKYIWIPEKNIPKDYKLNFSGLPYFKKISQPILVIQGLSDNVIPKNSYRIIERALKKSKEYKIILLENTTHSMTYLNKDFPYFQMLSPNYLTSITEWLIAIENN